MYPNCVVNGGSHADLDVLSVFGFSTNQLVPDGVGVALR